jgi:predicted DsbA family dithiol-disulfide isomerase
MNSTVTVHSDYVCPYCFFAEHLISQVADNEALTMEWIPDELRPAPQPTLRPDGKYLEWVWRDSGYPMAERLGLSIKVPNISPQLHTGLAFGHVLESRKYREHHLRAFRHAQEEAYHSRSNLREGQRQTSGSTLSFTTWIISEKD